MGYRRWLKTLGLGALATAGVVAVGSQTALQPTPALAQTDRTCQGFTLFGGVASEYRLDYCIDNNERRDTRARYYLKVPGRLAPRDIIEVVINYPEEFEEDGGYFTNATIELREGTSGRGGAAIPIAETLIDPDSNQLEIYPEAPLPANTGFTVVISDVRNPNGYMQRNFNLDVLYQGDSVRGWVALWQLDIAAE
jgi:hypothetical protein